MTTESNTEQRKLVVDGREFTYFFFAAKRADAPILFVLHGHDFGASPTSFRSEDWNVVCPMDWFGIQSGGSWYLGEEGDLFWLKAFPAIVSEVRKVSAGDLYFWGSSMGAYGALLHGYLNGARAVYANVPQTVLLDSSYSNSGMKKYFEKILGSEGADSTYNDLRRVMEKDVGCTYVLCFNQLEPSNYFAEQGLPFVSHLNAVGARLYLEVRPLKSHGKNHGIAETLALFEKYC